MASPQKSRDGARDPPMLLGGSVVPLKLYHDVPAWVEPSALFHIRIALDRHSQQPPLTTSALAEALIESAKFYDGQRRWYITVFMLMPDHIHAVLAFHRDKSMSRVIADWKHY